MNLRPVIRPLLAACSLTLLLLASLGCERMSAEAIFPEKMAEKKAAAEAAAEAATPDSTPLPRFFPGHNSSPQ
jgi:hypothetical protein